MALPFSLENLPAPTIIKEITYEATLAKMKENLASLNPAYTSIVEGDPAYTVLEVVAYENMDLRAEINEAIRAIYFATASGADLEHITAILNIRRRVVTPANLEADPPTPAVLESDEALKERFSLFLDALGQGSNAWYRFFAREADPAVFDTFSVSPTDGHVTVYIQSTADDGIADSALITKVRGYLIDESRKILCDTVAVESVTKVEYAVTAEITLQPGTLAEPIVAELEARVEEFSEGNKRFNRNIYLSALYAVMSVPGITNIDLTAPVANVTTTTSQIPVKTATTITVAS